MKPFDPDSFRAILRVMGDAGWCYVERGEHRLWIHESSLDALSQDGDIVWFPPPAIVPNPAILQPPVREVAR